MRDLERRYHRLLVAYPAGYRAERGPEIVATLLDGAAPGRRVPRPAEALDLVEAGLLQRLRVASVPGLAAGLAAAAPLALALAAGISAFLWWRVELAPSTVHTAQRWPFAGLVTLGPLAYAAWLLAALATATLRPAAGRFAVAVAVATTAVVVPVLATTSLGQRPPLWVLMALSGFGLIALGGTAPGVGAAAPGPEARLSGLAGTIAIAMSMSTVTRAWISTAEPGHTDYYGPTIARVGAVVVAVVAAVAIVAALRLLRRRPAHDLLWAAALLGLPAGWLGPFDLSTPSLESSTPHFGRLAQVLFATCVAVAVMHRLARRPPGSAARVPDTAARLTRAGFHALGTAIGLASWIALAHAGIAGPRPEAGARTPAYVVATLAVLVIVGLAATTVGLAATTVGLAATTVGLAAGRAAGGWPHLLSAAGATVVAAGLIAAYVNDWTLRNWAEFGHTAAVASAVALVPLSECAAVAAQARRGPVRRWTATAVAVGAAGWLAVLTVQYLPGWGPPLLGAAVCVAASAIATRQQPRLRRGTG